MRDRRIPKTYRIFPDIRSPSYTIWIYFPNRRPLSSIRLKTGFTCTVQFRLVYQAMKYMLCIRGVAREGGTRGHALSPRQKVPPSEPPSKFTTRLLHIFLLLARSRKADKERNARPVSDPTPSLNRKKHPGEMDWPNGPIDHDNQNLGIAWFGWEPYSDIIRSIILYFQIFNNFCNQ